MGYVIYNENTPQVRGVLFDMDGVVLDTEVLYTRFWMEACHFYGYPMTREQALGMRSLGAADGERNLRRWFGPEVNYHAVRAKRIELMEDYIEKEGVIPKPGARELLEYLRQRGIRTAIATSSPIERANAHLGSVGLDVLFDEICSGRQVANPKPAPDIYRYAAQKLGLKPEECLAIEDSPTGLESAYRAGCWPVMVPDQDQPDENTLKLLFAKADSLTDVMKWMGRCPLQMRTTVQQTVL